MANDAKLSRWERIGKSVILIIWVIGSSVLIVPLAFSAYSDAMKAQFNMTQTQVTVLESMLSGSMMFMIPSGIIYDRYGVLPTTIASLVVSTVGWAAVWLSVLLRKSLIGSPYAVWFAMALACHGRTYLTVMGSAYTPALVAPCYRPFVLALMDLSGDFGTFLCCVVYETYYVDGHVVDAANQDLADFMLLTLIMTAVIQSLITVLLPVGERFRYQKFDYVALDVEHDNDVWEGSDVSHGSELGTSNDIGMQPSTELVPVQSDFRGNLLGCVRNKVASEKSANFSTPSLSRNDVMNSYSKEICSLQFHFILWSIAIPMAVVYFNAFNITFVTRSLSLVRLNYNAVMFQKIATLSGKVAMACILALSRNRRYVNEIMVILGNVVLLFCHSVYLVLCTQPVFLSAAYFTICVLQGSIGLLLPITVHSYYGTARFAFVFSSIWSAVCVLSAVFQVSFGALYDSQIPPGGGQYCYGANCIASTYTILMSATVFSTLMSVSLLFLKFKTSQRMNCR